MVEYTLGIDPGERNFAYAVLDVEKQVFLEVGQIDSTIRNLTNKPQKPPKSRRKKEGPIPPLLPSLKRFVRTIKQIIKDYPNIKSIHSERYQARGIRSKSIESVSFTNGVLALMCQLLKISYSTFIAGTWKNRVNKFWGYKEALEELYNYGKLEGFSPHEIDAMCIAITKGGEIDPPSINKMKRIITQTKVSQCP